MSTDLGLAVCPHCGSGLPDCTAIPPTSPLWESWHRAFCDVASRIHQCDGCEDTGW